jgi:hypothetical protein
MRPRRCHGLGGISCPSPMSKKREGYAVVKLRRRAPSSHARTTSAAAHAGPALRGEPSAEWQTTSSLDRSSGSRLPVCALLGYALLGRQWLERGGGRRLGSLRQSRLCPASYRGKAPQIAREVEEGPRKPDFTMHLGTLPSAAAAIALTGHCASSFGPRVSFLSPTLYLLASTCASCCGTQHLLSFRSMYRGTIDELPFSVVS